LSEKEEDMNECWKKSLRRNCIGIGLILIFLVGVKIFIEYYATRQMTPRQKKMFKEFRTKKYYFAPEDLNASPFTSSTLAVRDAYQEIFKEHEKSLNDTYNKFEAIRKQEGKTTTTVAWENFCRDAPSAESVLAVFEKLVSQPDYELDCLSVELNINDSFHFDFPIPNFLYCVIVARMLQIRARAFLAEGKMSETLDTTAFIFRSSRTHHCSILIERLISIYFLRVGLQILYETTQQCDNPILLHRALEILQKSEPVHDLVEKDEDISITDSIGIIRQAKRLGITVDIQGKTALEIARAAFSDIPAAYLEKCFLPTVRDEMQRTMIKGKLADYKRDVSFLEGDMRSLKGLIIKICSPYYYSLIFSLQKCDFDDIYSKWRFVRVRIDILRCFMEQKIIALEHKGEIPQIPKDVFSSAGEPLHTKPVIYSMGPDGVNQQAGIYYDPTNGTISSGDIFFK
jgi:hypothetical protein